ncbi:MAG TPA: thermonuclease family protein [Burkholderiaceae bacterium]|nr:thermonuclease family protein [Burkholderiaceae bacterium]
MNKTLHAVLLCALIGLAGVAGAATKSKAPASPPEPVDLVGTVTRIVDGDTLWLKTAAGDKPVVVRLEGIDAPEICQPGGKEASAWLADLVLNRSVSVRVSATDDWGRKVGKVNDGTRDIGDRMVRDGHAWSQRYRYDRGPYMSEERMAQALKRGLHAADGAIEPREFRKRHGECPGSAEAPKSSANAPPAPTMPEPASVTAKAGLSCDGRVYCRQMKSCEEATWFLKNCPGVKMDGNRDGVPCEQQWCGIRR